MRYAANMRAALVFVFAMLSAMQVSAQWEIEDSHTTASLRGIYNAGGGVAWASGTSGTVLRTEDGGYLWQTCAMPPGAEKLDFRGIQAFDENTAIVMSSGPGEQSRLYKTSDGCQTWKLLFTNPDKDGFWDALFFLRGFDQVFILGDPVNGRYRLFSALTGDDLEDPPHFSDNWNGEPIVAGTGEAAFAASNSLFIPGVEDGRFSFITGGASSEFIHEEHGLDQKRGGWSKWARTPLPFASGESSGAFSVAVGAYDKTSQIRHVVVVGGDYKLPEKKEQTAATSADWGRHFLLSATSPHGYRSAVAYDVPTKSWITVGLNGTDISTDDGRNWHPLTPTPQDDKDADKNWNALSLPFVVGPHGRIGKLRATAITPAAPPSANARPAKTKP